jgi:hypothetical protein
LLQLEYIKVSLFNFNVKENITQENVIADLNTGGFAPVAKQ